MLKIQLLLLTLVLMGSKSFAGLEDGVRYFNSKDYAAAFNDLTHSVEANEPRAMYFLAVMYDQGLYVEKDEEKALGLFKKSSRLGNLASTLYLAEKGNATGYFDNIPKLEAAASILKEQLEPRGMLWELPKYANGVRIKDSLLDEYLELKKAIDNERTRAISIEYIGDFQWKVDDAVITFAVNKHKNLKYSFFDEFGSQPREPFDPELSWTFDIPMAPQDKSALTQISLDFSYKNNREAACPRFPGAYTMGIFDVSYLFKNCFGTISAALGENNSKPLIHFVFSLDKKFLDDYRGAILEFSAANKSYIRMCWVIFVIVSFVFSFSVVYCIYLFVARNLKGGMPGRKVGLKNCDHENDEVDKTKIMEVEKLDITALKNKIEIALDNGDTDKAKQLLDLAERLKRL